MYLKCDVTTKQPLRWTQHERSARVFVSFVVSQPAAYLCVWLKAQEANKVLYLLFVVTFTFILC